MNRQERETMLREKLATMSRYENELRAQGVVRIAGVDEVGRGPLAGPVCAAAVVLPQDFDVLGVDDSKKLSEKKREALYERIVERALAWGIGMTDNRRIDEINILNATKEAMLAALAEAGKRLKFPIERVLIDAVELPESGIPGIAIIKGDEKSVSVAAASIVAKVTRDRLMAEFDAVYQGYGFASNKGYGTKTHYESIAKLGLTPIHRRTFLRGSHSVFSR